jgi:hypothetical protein
MSVMTTKRVWMSLLTITMVLVAGTASGATLTLNSNMTVESLTISTDSANDTVDVGDWTLDVGAGGITIGTGTNAGTLISGASGQILCAGNWTLNAAGVFTHGDGTVVFDGSGAQTIAGGPTFYDLTISNLAAVPDSDNDVETSPAITVANTLSVTDGWFSPTAADLNIVSIGTEGSLVPGGDLTVAGNWTNSGVFDSGTTHTVTFDGASQVDTGGTGQAFNNVVLDGTSVTLAASPIKIDGTLALTTGEWILGGNSMQVTNTYTCENAAALVIKGTEEVTLTAGMDTDTGKLVYRAPGSDISVLTGDLAAVHDVELDDDADELTFTLGADATVNGLLALTDGTLDLSTYNLALNGGMTIAGDEAVVAGSGTITLADGQTVENLGTWGTAGSGEFVCSGSATFAGNDIAFYKFTADQLGGENLTFQDDATYSVANWLTLTGTTGNNLSIVRSGDGTDRPILQKNGDETVEYVSVDGVDGADESRTIVASNSSGTNYLWWQFGTGTALAGNWNTPATWTSGSVPGTSDSVDIAHNVTLDTNTSVNGLTVSANTLTFGAGQILTANGAVNIAGAGAVDVNDGTLNAESASSIAGTLTIGSGTYNANNSFDANGGNVTFADAGTLNLAGSVACGGLGIFTRANGCTVDYKLNGDQPVSAVDYWHLNLSGGGTKTLCEAIDVEGNLTVATGVTLDVSNALHSITIAGNWTNNGAFTHADGTVTFDGDSGDSILTPGASPFYALHLNKADSAMTLSPSANLTVSNALTITKGTFDLDTSDVDLSLGGALSIAADGLWAKSSEAGNTVTFTGDCTFSDSTGSQNIGNVVVN